LISGGAFRGSTSLKPLKKDIYSFGRAISQYLQNIPVSGSRYRRDASA
jgi:hypothetical protein